MKKLEKLKCIMLVDDNPDDNFYHQRIIKKADACEQIIIKESGFEALDYLTYRETEDPRPDLIFLDLNMPGMDGWEFLEEHEKLSKNRRSKEVIIMLTTSDNPDHLMKSRSINHLTDYLSKPLTVELLNELMEKYFVTHKH